MESCNICGHDKINVDSFSNVWYCICPVCKNTINNCSTKDEAIELWNEKQGENNECL